MSKHRDQKMGVMSSYMVVLMPLCREELGFRRIRTEGLSSLMPCVVMYSCTRPPYFIYCLQMIVSFTKQRLRTKEALSLEQIILLSAVGLKINYQKPIVTFGLQLCIS